MKRLLLLLLMVSTIECFADEYIDPATNVIYTYKPGQNTASVKEGYEPVSSTGGDSDSYQNNPDVAGDVAILDKFTVGTEEYIVTSIGNYAFCMNANIKSVSIPETVTNIGVAAFECCDGLTAVQLPEGLTRISRALFGDCRKLQSVAIPSSVRAIDEQAFDNCLSLASLTLPAGLNYIGRYAFRGTPWYSTQYNEAPNGLFYIGPQLVGYKGDAPTGELVIKDGTTCIGYQAFNYCTGLTSVTIPESLTHIDYRAFYNCVGLTAVHITDLAAWCGIEFQWDDVSSSSNPLFYAHHLYLNGEEVTDPVIPDGATSIGRYAFDNCTGLTSVTIPDGVTRIRSNAFRNCSNLTSVTIPPSVAIIESLSFLWCNNLTAVHISDLAAWCGISFQAASDVFNHGARLYLNGEEVSDLVIPDGVASIGSWSFMNCNQLTSVTIPESVTKIGENAFFGCKNLTDVYCHAENVPSTGYGVFYSTPIASVTLHVPAGSLEMYKTTEPWSEFGNIVAMEDEDSHFPFVEEGKVWNMYYHNDYAHDIYPTYHYRYFIEGDTLIGGQNCKKFYAFNENNDNQTEYKMALFESERKVFFIPNGSVESHLLYDFMIPVGSSVVTADPIHPDSDIEMRNNKNEIGKINGINRPCLLVNRVEADFGNYPSGWWIEGIGSELGPLNTWRFGADGDHHVFWSCEIGGECIYNQSNLFGASKDEYYLDGTRWTEIRLDTMKYDSWYSKVGDEWVPNFETIEYYVQGEYLARYEESPFKRVYTNGPEWNDSLTFLIREIMYGNIVEVTLPAFDEEDPWGVMCPAETYQFNWRIGKGLYYRDFGDSNTTGIIPHHHYYGIINEIKEGDFGGVRPLKYVDLDGKAPNDNDEIRRSYNHNTNGGRIIHGIGITEWNDGECLFGPPNLWFNGERHYRSMLVHFERNGEVLYNVWPKKETAAESVTFTKDQMATIILPTAPDASKGKYYKLDRCEDGQIVFIQETQPQARTPYIIVPNEDFSIDMSTLDVAGLNPDTVTVGGISFIGSYVRTELPALTGGDGGGSSSSSYYDIIDQTPDCQGAASSTEMSIVGALRAYLVVKWDDPIDYGGTRSPQEKMELVLLDEGDGISRPTPGPSRNGGEVYDLSGRHVGNGKWKIDNGKLKSGIYIINGKKKVLMRYAK